MDKTLPVSAWGYELLLVAALFGVVGINEKYVLVPKACGERSRTNDKPEGDMLLVDQNLVPNS